MAFEWNPTIFINLVLCIIIVILGILCWKKSAETLPLYIAAAFGLFGISHVATLLGMTSGEIVTALIVIRALAYLLVVFALIQYLRSSLMAKETRQAWIDYYKDDGKKEER